MIGFSGSETCTPSRVRTKRGAGSRRIPAKAGVAQLVEQLIRNQQVISSSLIAGSKKQSVHSRSNDADPGDLAGARLPPNCDLHVVIERRQ